MSLDLTDDKSTLVQLRVTRPQWVKGRYCSQMHITPPIPHLVIIILWWTFGIKAHIEAACPWQMYRLLELVIVPYRVDALYSLASGPRGGDLQAGQETLLLFLFQLQAASNRFHPSIWYRWQLQCISNGVTVKSLIQDAPNPKTQMFIVSACSCLCPIHWSHVLSWEWRCSWSSAHRRCSNYMWVIKKSMAYLGASYIWDFTLCLFCIKPSIYLIHQHRYIFYMTGCEHHCE